MSSNRRYADAIDRRMDARIAERIMRSGDPQSLTPAEQERGHVPMTRDPNPGKVRAWVRYPAGTVEIEALAVAWTARTVAITWPGPDDVEHRAWVWVGAVERI